MKKKKKLYEPPSVRKVRVDIKASVLGACSSSPELVVMPCVVGGGCPTVPTPTP